MLLNIISALLNSNAGRAAIGLTFFAVGSLATYYFIGRPSVDVEVSRACLECHTDLKAKFQVKTKHFPFDRLLCNSCHSPHGVSIAKAQQARTFTGFYRDKVGDLLRTARGVTQDPGPSELIDPKISEAGATSGGESGGASSGIPTEASADVLGKPEAPPVTIAKTAIDATKAGEEDFVRPDSLVTSALVVEQPNLCIRCHSQQGEEMKKKTVMPPFAGGKCTTCHDPHGSDFPAATAKKVPDLCFGCHDSIKLGPPNDLQTTKDWREQPVQMGPFEQGQCVNCHYPHGTDTDKLLKKGGVPNLCYSCHDGMNLGGGSGKDWKSMPSQMPPFKAGKCLQCHVPHGSPYRRLLKQKVPDLCFSCHQSAKDGGSAPDIKSQFELPSHHPVPEGKLSCLNCHYPMAGPNPKLLQKPFRKNTGSCATCHVPHGSYGVFLNAGENRKKTDMGSAETLPATPQDATTVAVCTQCHKKNVYATGDSHPVADRFDPNAGREISCISTCHSGLYFPDMDVFKNTLCLYCHTGHNAPSTAIGSLSGRETKLLRKSHAEIRARTWQQAPPTSSIIEAPHVDIETPTGRTKANASNLEPKAVELVGKYMRLGVEDQFKIRRDRGCMLCHNVRQLP